MKVAFIANSFPRPFDLNMGSYNYSQVYALNRILGKRKDGSGAIVISCDPWIPKVLAPLGGNIKKHALLPRQYVIEDFGNVYSPKMFNYGRILRKHFQLEYKLYSVSIKNKIEKILKKEQVDFVVAVGFLLEGQLALQIKRELGIPFAVVEHSNSDIYWAEKNKKAKELYSKIALAASKVFFVSKASQKLFNEHICRLENSTVNSNGGSEDIPYCDSIEKKNDMLSVSTVGFLEKRKGYFYSLDALNKYHNTTRRPFQWTIVGEGTLLDELQNKISQYGLSEYCHFTGKIPHDAVFDVLYSSDIFLLPSYDEPFGIAYLEAMISRNVVIGTTGEGVEDIVDNGINGFLVDKGDTDGICKILLQLDNDKIFLRKVQKEACDAAVNFTWENNAKRLLEALEVFN